MTPKQAVLEHLIKLADTFDTQGLHSVSAEIDALAKKVAESSFTVKTAKPETIKCIDKFSVQDLRTMLSRAGEDKAGIIATALEYASAAQVYDTSCKNLLDRANSELSKLGMSVTL